MKKFYFLLLLINANLLFGQLKTIRFDANTPKSQVNETLITTFNLRPFNGNATEFSPKSLNNDLKAKNWRFKVLASSDNGMPIAIEGKASNASANRSMGISEKATNHLSALSATMKISNPEDEFTINNIMDDGNGIAHVRMSQKWNNIPVYGAEIILHSTDGDFDFMNGRYYVKPTDLITSISINEAASINLVKADLGVEKLDFSKFDQIFNIPAIKSELVYYRINDNFKLAYHHTTYKNLIDRWEYFIDAATGQILNKYQSICKFHNHEGGHSCSTNFEKKRAVI